MTSASIGGGLIDAGHRHRRGSSDRDLPQRSSAPHLHALFAGQEAKLSIATGEVLGGKLSRTKLKAVQMWLDANREQVSYIWREIRAGRYSGGMIA